MQKYEREHSDLYPEFFKVFLGRCLGLTAKIDFKIDRDKKLKIDSILNYSMEKKCRKH